ncbi:trypsin-like serine protease [Corynebacterium propinquum]|uniref:trypsin-like serine protease n=1 Tax=Corynebacterium propinquum TaxID=43769 RepID=UPI002542C1CB|nr:trypsin-like serine protease [Corynebacterium propinquum]MDK4282238.1 trypsin-like serine protease [Corynebacterium propinquum]
MSIKKIALSLAAATTMAASIIAAPAAHAVQGGTPVSDDDALAKNVVIVGGCTGTAISPHWILAAKHCFGNHTTAHLLHTGVEKTGVDGTEEAYHAPTGDIALVRMSTHSAFKFDSYPELATEAPKPGQVGTFYGWDSTAHKRLPHSQAEVKNLYQNGSYNNGKMYTVHHKDGAYAQPGDSGGPLFIDGKLSGVASAISGKGTSMNLADISAEINWIKQTMARNGDEPNLGNGAVNGMDKLLRLKGFLPRARAVAAK